MDMLWGGDLGGATCDARAKTCSRPLEDYFVSVADLGRREHGTPIGLSGVVFGTLLGRSQ